MKKQILLYTFIFTAFTVFAQKAQKTKKDKTTFGVQAGLASYNMSGDAVGSLKDVLAYSNGIVSAKSRTGFFAGATADIPLSEQLSFSPGLFYTQKGYELKGELNIKGAEFLGANATAKLQSQFIDLPLLLKAKLGSVDIFAGPQFSYLLRSDFVASGGVLGVNLFHTKSDISSQFSKWNTGVTAGIGFNIDNINFSASYDYGLSKADANKNIDAYNRGVKVGLGINF